MAAETLLASWRDTPARKAVTDFVENVTSEGSAGFVEAAERVAVFDNDGTLWSEKPIPIQLDFTLFRMAGRAQADPSLRGRQLLRYLEANGFSTYIASGGDRDFMRPFAGQLYGIPPERVIGSANSTMSPGPRRHCNGRKSAHGRW